MRRTRLPRGVLALTVALPALASLAIAPEESKPKATLSAQQAAKIASAKTAEQLVQIAAEFYASGDELPAATAIEKACTLKPELLTDSKALTPKPWNEFWFAHRAAIQERRLKTDDAPGRVRIAKWLHDAESPAAGRLLAAALRVDKSNAEAQSLAREWGVAITAPFAFDLTYGLTQPMLVPGIKDEGVEVLVPKKRQVLILPFVYNPVDTKLLINKANLKVTSDDGKVCPIRGIALLTGATAGQQSGAQVMELKLQPDNDPLWERLDIEPRKDKGTAFELTCYNTMPPVAAPVRPTAGAPRGAREAPTGRGPRERMPAPITPVEPRTSGAAKQTKQGDGDAAFILDAPLAFKYVNCDYRGAAPLRLEAGLLAALAGAPKEAGASQAEAAVRALIGYSVSQDAVAAGAAVRKLALLRPAGQPAAAGTPGKADPAGQKIEEALLAAAGHPDAGVRRSAMNAVLHASAGSEPATEIVRSCPTENLLRVLDELKAVLAAPPPTADGTAPPAPQFVQPPAASGDDALSRAVADLPAASAPPRTFIILAGCLEHPDAAIRERAAAVLLGSATRDAALVLAKAPREVRAALLAGLKGIANQPLRSALARIFLYRADDATLDQVLAGCDGLSMTITREDDPLLTALASAASPATAQKILELLARSELSALANSEQLRKILDSVAGGQAKNATACAALLKLAVGQLKSGYEAPIKREQQGSGPPAKSPFEGLLATLAATGVADSAQAATEALIASGHVAALNEAVRQNASPARRQELLKPLLKNRKLWDRESLPVFLAARLSDQDPQTAPVALAALAVMSKSIDARQRWRFNLAVKQGLEYRQLLDLSASPDEKIGPPATELLVRLSCMPSATEAEFRAATEKQIREQKVTDAEKTRSTTPAGRFMAILYVDLKPTEKPAQPGAAPVAPPALPRVNVPLIASSLERPVTMVQEGQRTRVLYGEQVLNVQATAAAGERDQSSLRIKLAPLLRAAMASPDAAKEGLPDKLDLVPLSEPRECPLKYEQLGTWTGEFTIQDTSPGMRDSTPGADKPLRLTGGKLFLEPLPPS